MALVLFFTGPLHGQPLRTRSRKDAGLFPCFFCNSDPFSAPPSSNGFRRLNFAPFRPSDASLFRSGNDGSPGELPGPGSHWSGWRELVPGRLLAGDASWWPQTERNPLQKHPKDKKSYSPTATTGSPGHIFWVIPAFKVNYAGHFQPLTPKEKFQEWAQSTYDPMGLGVGAFEAATLEYSSSDGFCGYGFGWGGYGECFGSLELDATDSSFIGDFVLPVVLHQDPRYFRLGKGSFRKRAWYAISRVFVTYSDSGRTVFYSSALSGTVIAAGLSNFYYPSQDVGLSHTMTRIAIDLGNTALYNLSAEFWPDIDHRIHRAL